LTPALTLCSCHADIYCAVRSVQGPWGSAPCVEPPSPQPRRSSFSEENNARPDRGFREVTISISAHHICRLFYSQDIINVLVSYGLFDVEITNKFCYLKFLLCQVQ
jgi:hypothetical protein